MLIPPQKLRIYWPGWLSLVCCWLGLARPAAGQGQWQPIPALGQHQLYQLAQDATGYLWLATDEGVYRFDGYHTVSLTELSGGHTRLAATRHVLALGSQRDLWALSAAGLFHYSLPSGRLTSVPLPPRATHWPVGPLGLVADTARNRLWVLLDAHRVVGYSLDKGQLVPGAEWKFADPVIGLTGEPAGGVWVQSQNRDLTYLGPGQPRQHYRTGGRFMYPLVGTRPQRFASVSALYAARGDSTLHETRRWLSPRLADFPETAFFLPEWQSGHEQWIVGDSLVSLRRKLQGRAVGEVRVEPIPLDRLQPYSQVVYYRSFTDRLGTEWWFSPTLRGCYRRHRSAYVQPLPLESGKWYSSRAICRLPDRRLLVSSYSGLLVQHPGNGGTLQPLTTATSADQLHTRAFMALLPLPTGQLLAGDDFGLYFLTLPDTVSRGQLQPLRGPGVPPDLQVTALLPNSSGRVWIGSLQGLYWLDTAQPWPHPYRPARAVRNIRALAADSAGYLWLATTDGLYRLSTRSGQLQHYAYELPGAHHLPSNELLSLCSQGRQVWVGTRDQGLLLLDPSRGILRVRNRQTGLPSNTVCSLLADQRGSLWLGTYGGVVQYRPGSGQLAVLTAANGLADNECNYASALLEADSAVYFGSVRGVTRLDANWRKQALSPQRRLVVSRLDLLAAGDTAARRRYPYPGQLWALTLRDEAAATIQLALTDYLNPVITQYQYQIQGRADSAWYSLTGTHQLRLQYLPAGDFALRVRAEAAGGLPAANTLTIPVRVRHTWWKNRWLWAFGTLALLAGAGGYAWRTYRQQRHQRLELRRRLTRDLHDELGALLVRASLQTEYLQVEFPPTSPLAIPLLQDLRAATQAMRDIVWGLDPHNNSLGDLLDQMREYVARLMPLTPYPIVLDAVGVQPARRVPAVMRQHLYAIFKEAVTNALRHARQPTELRIILQQHENSLLLEVRDDGQAQPVSQRRGVGLRSMRERAQLLRGQLEVGPFPEAGFRVRLQVSI